VTFRLWWMAGQLGKLTCWIVLAWMWQSSNHCVKGQGRQRDHWCIPLGCFCWLLRQISDLGLLRVSEATLDIQTGVGVGIDGICASCPICVAEPYHCIIQQLLVRPMCV
jgi:hypothetical protein